MTQKDLPVIPSNRADDLQGLEIAEKADLVLFMAGNQFMVMKEIVAEFKTQYPEVKNIFYETLPPGNTVAYCKKDCRRRTRLGD